MSDKELNLITLWYLFLPRKMPAFYTHKVVLQVDIVCATKVFAHIH